MGELNARQTRIWTMSDEYDEYKEPQEPETETPKPKARPAKKAAPKAEGKHGTRSYVGKPYERKSVAV
jgi:hypothetical protein